MTGGRFYFDWWTYRRMLTLLRAERPASRRLKLYAAFLFALPAVAALHAICFALDPLLFPSLRRTEVRRPIFCVGHARSGTTYLHRLMTNDPQFSYVLLYEMFFPSLLEKRLLRLLLGIDEKLFGSRLRRRLDAVDDKAFAATNDMHRTGLFTAEEDDFLLTFSLASGSWIVLFPYLDQLDFYHVDRWPSRKRRRVMQFYRECVRRQVALNGGGTLLSKNPTFCGRVESLIETFPDAGFIVPVRNPYDTIPSLLKMLQNSWRLQGRDEQLIQTSLRTLADQSYHSYTHPLEVLAAHPGVRSCVVDYRDLVGHPSATMFGIYRDLGLPAGPAATRAFERADGQTHETAHHYNLQEFGLDPDEIRTRLAPLFDEFGWDADHEEYADVHRDAH
ncbi:sulfotransferase [Mycobacterium sp. Y57]|uniref:sulfotransferase family protein n=1 Tax=Mycolicibacterium xanthum TaxID=2796469 RepID=UPI001C852AC9|nr:sulfotransferase [Mycolicibacterium xanthum]MBX7434711.1 sulfotransferase [Mycolicibacterium xanthum]